MDHFIWSFASTLYVNGAMTGKIVMVFSIRVVSNSRLFGSLHQVVLTSATTLLCVSPVATSSMNPLSLERVIGAGYWPGSPKDCSYFFAQDLFSQWDFLQKRLSGTSEVAFLKALSDFSKSKGRVSAFY